MRILYLIFQVFFIISIISGINSDSYIFGINTFYIYFIYNILLFTIDYSNVSSHISRPLQLFFIIGILYVILSFIGLFGGLFNYPHKISFILRQSFFVPYIIISIPLFIRSFQYGLFNFAIKHLSILIPVFYLLLDASIFYSLLLVYSLSKYKISLIIFISILFYEFSTYSFYEFSLQILLIQLLVLIFYLYKRPINIRFISIIIISLIFGGYFIQDNWVSALYLIDAHAAWRLSLWVDNIKSTINDTFLIGHGFGTSYFAAAGREIGDFILEGLQQRSNYAAETLRSYSLYQAELVLAQHNSFVNIFFRIGLIGIILFMGIYNYGYKILNRLNVGSQIYYILLISMVVIGVNVGLENPNNATIFSFLLGLVFFVCVKYRDFRFKIYNIE
jgi:hypothetical protein